MAKLALTLLLLLIVALAALETAAARVQLETVPTETLTESMFPIP